MGAAPSISIRCAQRTAERKEPSPARAVHSDRNVRVRSGASRPDVLTTRRMTMTHTLLPARAPALLLAAPTFAPELPAAQIGRATGGERVWPVGYISGGPVTY